MVSSLFHPHPGPRQAALLEGMDIPVAVPLFPYVGGERGWHARTGVARERRLLNHARAGEGGALWRLFFPRATPPPAAEIRSGRGRHRPLLKYAVGGGATTRC